MLARFAAPNLARSATSFQIRAHSIVSRYNFLVYKKSSTPTIQGLSLSLHTAGDRNRTGTGG